LEELRDALNCVEFRATLHPSWCRVDGFFVARMIKR